MSTVLFVILAACTSGTLTLDEPGKGNIGQGEADADTDADSDADADADTDADTDTDTDTDTDSDADEDSEWMGEWESWVGLYAYVDYYGWETGGEGYGEAEVGSGEDPDFTGEAEAWMEDWDDRIFVLTDAQLDGDSFDGELIIQTYGSEVTLDAEGEFWYSEEEGLDVGFTSGEGWVDIEGFDVYLYVEQWVWR